MMMMNKMKATKGFAMNNTLLLYIFYSILHLAFAIPNGYLVVTNNPHRPPVRNNLNPQQPATSNSNKLLNLDENGQEQEAASRFLFDEYAADFELANNEQLWNSVSKGKIFQVAIEQRVQHLMECYDRLEKCTERLSQRICTNTNGAFFLWARKLAKHIMSEGGLNCSNQVLQYLVNKKGNFITLNTS